MSKRKLRLCIVTFGVIVSLIVFTPPCSPLKIQATEAMEQLNVSEEDHASKGLKHRLHNLITSLAD